MTRGSPPPLASAGDNGEGFGTYVDLQIRVPEMDNSNAEGRVKKANPVCPCSPATHGNIDMRTSIA